MNSPRLCRILAEAILPFGPCVLCGGDSHGGPAPGLCRTCWRERLRPVPPLCPVCGMPLPPVEGQEAHPCGACLADPPAYEAHASAYAYKGPVRALVLLYKDNRRYPLAAILGTAVARAVRKAWPEETWDFVAHVPSPFRRRLVRGFEPAGLVAREAAKKLGLPWIRVLRPRKATRTQKGLTAAQRKKNLQGAFEARKVEVHGKRILLVDDVRTTGATLREAAKVLARHGAKVHAATVATVLKRELDLMSAEVPPEEERE